MSANQKHGLRRSHKDKQRIVRNARVHPYGASLSDQEIARHCGIDHKTVGKIRKELETTGEIPQLDRRVVQKADGTTYEINTSNIGSTPIRKEETHHGESIAPTRYGEPPDIRWPDTGRQAEPNAGYEPTAQEFECPRCGQEKIVGVNGSRRWCLNCLAEWPTAAAFLHEVDVVPQPTIEPPTHQQLQNRFLNILACLDERDGQLGKINFWLDTLEAQLDLPRNVNDKEETVSQISSSPVPEYAQ